MNVEEFGTTGTATETTATLQQAFDYCGANKLELNCLSREYTIDGQITLPAFVDAYLPAKFLRAPGAVFDMFVANGSLLNLRGLQVDGQRQLDGLNWSVAAERFCGFRLIGCSGYIENLRADNTVSAEIQSEGIRAGIMLESSVDLLARRLAGSGNMGSAIFAYQGANDIEHVRTSLNAGSGFTSYGANDLRLRDALSNWSGYSGISLNGERIIASGLVGISAAAGYACVNIGHDSDGNRSHLAIVSDVIARSSLGYGISVIGSSGVHGVNWKAHNSAHRGLNIRNSPGLRLLNGETRLGSNNDLHIEGAGEYFIDGDFRGGPSRGLHATGSGVIVNVSPQTVFAGYGSSGGITGGVMAENGAKVNCSGQLLANRYGAMASGSGSAVDVRKGSVSGSSVAPSWVSAGASVLV